MFELMFGKFELKLVNVNDSDTQSGKPINRVLTQQALDVRYLSAINEEEREITRLLHCAALNCCISIVSLKEEEMFYKFIFLENREKNQLIWEKIIDCNRKYDFLQTPSTIRKDRKKLINIRKMSKGPQNPFEPTASYFHQYDLTCSTLLEDVHPFDLNDFTILAQAKVTTENDQRLNLSFENDEFNDHECMAMITGVLVHMFNNEIASLPDVNRKITDNQLPIYFKLIRNAFATQRDNVRLFLMKVICNTKNAFLPYIGAFFTAISSSIVQYLERNRLNYIIRDVLVILIESKYEVKEDIEKELAQQLIECLIEKSPDLNTGLYKYNLEIIESLCKMWSLKIPQNLSEVICANGDLAIRVIVILLRNFDLTNASELVARQEVRKLIEDSIQNWKQYESSVKIYFEAVGWLLRFSDEESHKELLAKLTNHLNRMEKQNRDRCAQCVCAIFRGYRTEPQRCSSLFKFVNPKHVTDNHKAECFEFFYQRITNIEPLNLPTELLLIDLKAVLRERILACEGPALKIVERLVTLLPESEFRQYLDLVFGFTGISSSLLEHRRLAYSILMETYLKYPPPHAFGLLCSPALVRGLEDPAEEIQEFVLTFWRDKLKLPETCYERLVALLDIYDPELRDCFPRFLCLMMLELTNKSLDSDRPMFKQLTDCTFQDYQLFVPRRSANLGSMAPLFAPSLASQLGRLSQVGLSQQNMTFAATMQLLATRDLEFEPTAQNLPSSAPRFDYKAKIPDPSQNKLSKRIISEPRQFVSEYSQEAIQRKSEYHEKLKKEVDRQRNSAKFYRKYRIGDFPDVELTQKTFVESLRRMIMRDWLVCKDLAVALICSIIERLRGTDKFENFVDKASAGFKQVLQDQRDKNNFAPVVLEIVLQALSEQIKLDANTVQKICKTTGLHSLGILLMEKNILSKEMDTREKEMEEPPAKRMKSVVPLPEKEDWIELANLYKCQGEIDIVNSIFRMDGILCHDAREAVLAQAENDWLTAKNSYERAYEVAIGSEKEHCLEGMFECLAELSSWGEINRKIEIILNDDYDSVWKDLSLKPLLPWIFESHLHKALEDFTANKDPENESFIKNFGNWIQKTQDAIAMRRRFGEEMAVFYLCDEKKEETSRHCLKCCLDHVRDQWIRLSPLSEKIRTGILLKLRGIRIIDDYVNVLQLYDMEEAVEGLIRHWDEHSPSLSQDFLSWNKHVSYRLTFAHLLHGKLVDSDLVNRGILNELISAMARQRIKMSDLAMKNKNNIVAKKHTFVTEKLIYNLDDDEFSKLKNDFTLTASKYKFSCSQVEKNVKKQCKYFVSSWQISQSILEDEKADLSTKINVKYHLCDLTLALKHSAENNSQLLNLLRNNEFVINSTEAEDPGEVLGALKHYSFKVLKSACENGSTDEMAKSYLQLGKFCYESLQSGGNHDTYLLEEFISSILNAMSLGSSEAAQYFPCLLKYEYYWNNEKVSNLFSVKSESVPSWMFLSWQTQIMSYLSKPLGQLLVPIMQRLITDYPNGVMYNFRQTYEAQPDLKVKSEIREMYESLFAERRLETFFKALHYICQPEHYLKHHLLQAIGSVENYSKAIDSLLDQLISFSNQEIKESSLQGLLYKELDKYRVPLEKLKGLDYGNATEYARNIADDLYKAMKKRLQNLKYRALQLKDYSPYLGYFSGEDFEIEIPGQYKSGRKPLPRYHTKILKFDRFIRVMDSKCNPIKVSVIGNNASNYGFLVKFGEDLRQDQRLQQIFEIANKTLDNNIVCKRRYLSINTYQVVPLSTSLGLIQWVDETKSLKEFVEFSMNNKEAIGIAMVKYQNWIDKIGKSGEKTYNYKNALLKYNSIDVVSKMKELIDLFEWDCLRKTFVTLSPSLECFVSLRHNFITSYATMCTIHWITGVGDRHLENMLIEVKSGKCYGIDFGSAFGTGVEQTIPELVPFRLTAQILGLLKPFDEYALFGVTMTHVLKALRKEKGPMLACLDVFINEPLDWGKLLNKELQEEEEQHINIVKWLPKQKIAIVEKKLNGIKPSTIMLEELSNLYKDSDENNDEFLRYKHIIDGTDYHQVSVRSKMKNSDLSSKEQVQCLLEQATDLNVLGHMYVGWCPFV